jgi:hypothetical protein
MTLAISSVVWARGCAADHKKGRCSDDEGSFDFDSAQGVSLTVSRCFSASVSAQSIEKQICSSWKKK